MQTPEKLSLIGGSILLASTLIFTLKSQASHILPKVEHPIDSIYDHAGDATHGSSFPSDFKDAQRDGDATGSWGSAKYYINKQGDMYIGPGKLHDSLYDNIGQQAHAIRSLNFTSSVQAPSDSTRLLSGAKDDGDWNNSIVDINGTQHIDTSQVTNMHEMIFHNTKLKDIDISHWDTSQVQSIMGLFGMDYGLSNINTGSLNVSHVSDASWSFFEDTSLQHLDLNGWHSNGNAHTTDSMFLGSNQLHDLGLGSMDTTNDAFTNGFNGNTALQKLTLGNDTRLGSSTHLQNGEWEDGHQTLSTPQLTDGNIHPGTWIKQ